MNYNIIADVDQFRVDKFVMSQKIEAQTLRVTANNQGYEIKGDVKIGGTRRPQSSTASTRGDADAEVRLQAMFDDAARSALRLRSVRRAHRADADQARRARFRRQPTRRAASRSRPT